ncbi:MAG TPA: hypothetical protein VF941_11185 [Clostridia bacterium]
MKSRKKLIIVSVVCFVFTVALVLVWFFYTHSTYYKYNDSWIIGRHIEEIEKKYGKFDKGYDKLKAYYLYTDDGPIMPSHLQMYYWIKHDEKGIVVKVYVGGPIGG